MAEKIPQHSHCQVCGKAIPFSETLCSDECKEKYNSLVKRRKLFLYFMYAAIFVAFIVMIFLKDIIN